MPHLRMGTRELQVGSVRRGESIEGHHMCIYIYSIYIYSHIYIFRCIYIYICKAYKGLV